MQIVITVAGQGQRFQDLGYTTPKPIVPVLNKPAIHYLIRSLSKDWKLFFVLGEHFRHTEVESTIKNIKPNCTVIYTKYSQRGPVDTILAAVPYLDSSDSVAVSYCDYAMVWEPKDFESFVSQTNCDISIVSYRGFHPTYLGPNTYAHLKVDTQSNQIQQIQEKKLFGKNIEEEWTSIGFYYFKTVELLKKGLQLQLEKNLKHGNEFYTSLAVQALMYEKTNYKVLNYQISHVVQMGTPEDVKLIEQWYNATGPDLENTEMFNEAYQKQKSYWSVVFSKLMK